MIARDYASLVRDAYLSLGDRYLDNYITITDPPKVPIVDLKFCLLTIAIRVNVRTLITHYSLLITYYLLLTSR